MTPPLLAYYLLRTVGQSEYVALLTATVLSGLKVTYDAVRVRRLDPFAACLLLTFGLSLAVGLTTTNPKVILVGNTTVYGIGALLFLGSCFLGTPLTQVVADRIRRAHVETKPRGETIVRPVHVLLSAIWGVGLLVAVGARLVVISRASLDLANWLGSVISLLTMGLLIVATMIVARQARTRGGSQRRAAPPPTGATAIPAPRCEHTRRDRLTTDR